MPILASPRGHRCCVPCPRRAAVGSGTGGWLGQCAYIDAAHRVHARVEDVIRTGKDTGLGHLPRLRGEPGVADRLDGRLDIDADHWGNGGNFQTHWHPKPPRAVSGFTAPGTAIT
jgi:hypothetical protein